VSSMKKYYNEHLEANLDRLMAEKGLTGAQMGERMHCTEGAFNNYKKGRRFVTDDILQSMATALDVAPEDLLSPNTFINNKIMMVAESLGRDDLSPEEQVRYSDATYHAIPEEQSHRILLEENAKREVGEYIVAHPRAYVLVAVLSLISGFVFVFYPEPRTKAYSGIIMCALGMLISKSIKKPKKTDRILDVALGVVMIALIILFMVLGFETALQ